MCVGRAGTASLPWVWAEGRPKCTPSLLVASENGRRERLLHSIAWRGRGATQKQQHTGAHKEDH